MVQDDAGIGVLTEFEQSAPAMWHEQGAWEEPMQEADKGLQVAKAFFHTNLVTHPGPLPTRSSQAKFFRTHSSPQRSKGWIRDICDKVSKNNSLPL